MDLRHVQVTNESNSINISNAITLGLQQHLHLKGNQINVALAIFYVPYVLFEIPSNFLLRKFKPHVWRTLSLFLSLLHSFHPLLNFLLTRTS